MDTSTPTEPRVFANEFAIERLVGHGVNTDPGHPFADLNESMFKVRWTGYGSKDDTFEPIHHIPANAVIRYCKQKGLPIPNDIGRAQAG